MATVTGRITRPDGAALTEGRVVFQLVGDGARPLPQAWSTVEQRTIVGTSAAPIGPTGDYEIDLEPNNDLLPTGTRWVRVVEARGVERAVAFLTVPAGGGNERDLLADAPGEIDPPALAALILHINQLEADLGAIDGRVGQTETDVADLADQLGQIGAGSTVVCHDWARDGWAPFEPVVITPDAQTYEHTVSDGRGVVTGTQAGGGSHRVAYLREGTEWADSEITSLIVGPTGWNGTNAQQGHIHRVRPVDGQPGHWEGIAVWTSVVFGLDYRFLHVSAVRWQPTADNLRQSTSSGEAGETDAAWIDRQTGVRGRVRRDFGGFGVLDVLKLATPLDNVEAGDMLEITNVGSGFDRTAEVASVARGYAEVTLVSSGSAIPFDVVGEGEVTPVGQQRWVPYYMATRVRGGSTSGVLVEVKRWRPTEPEPDWSDPRVRRVTVEPNAEVPAVAVGAGRCALWAAHFNGGSSGAFGAVRFAEV